MSRLRLRASESFSLAAVTLFGVIAIGACGADPESSNTKGIGPGPSSGGSTGGTLSAPTGGTSPVSTGGSTGAVSSTGGVKSTGGMVGAGAAASGGTPTTGGVMSTGGVPSATGGTPATTGGTLSGGAASGGASAGSGGVSTGGSGGGSAGMTGGGKPAPEPSSGCGKANPQLGSAGSPLNASNHQYYVKVPSGYDGMKPLPVIFMFNPTGNPIDWAEKNAGFEKNAAKDAAIRVYPHPANSSSGWGAGDVSFFKPLYDKITGDFCVDKARVFAAGESSGGDFSSILGCEHADLLRSIGPCATKNVPQYPLDASKRKCTGQVAAVIIHSEKDQVVMFTNGPPTRDFYRTLNHCGEMTTPVMGYTDMKSNCVLYQGCDADYPVYWCKHLDPEYNGTYHGWPAFAANFLWELWSTY